MKLLFPLFFSFTTLAMAWFAFYTYSPLFAHTNKFYYSFICAMCFVLLFVGLLVLERFLFGVPAQLVAWIKSIIGSVGYYLFVTSVVLLFASLIFLSFGKSLPTSFLWSGITVTLLCSVIGFVYAKMPVITSYSIQTKQEELVDKKIVLVSDLHIGNLNNKNFLEKTVANIQSQNPDYVVIAGDTFDGPDVETNYFIDNFKKLTSSIPVIYAPGNHEEYGPYNKFISTIKDSGIVVLEDDFKKVDDILFIGFKYHNKETLELREYVSTIITKAFASLKTKEENNDDNQISKNETFSLVINHAPIFISTFEKEGIDLSVHGHTHRGQFWPNRYLTKLMYGDYHYGHIKTGNLNVITSNGIGLATVYNRLFNRPEVVVITLVRE